MADCGIKNSIAKKNWLYKLSKTRPALENVYKVYKNKLTKLLRLSFKTSYVKISVILKNHGKSKKMFYIK